MRLGFTFIFACLCAASCAPHATTGVVDEATSVKAEQGGGDSSAAQYRELTEAEALEGLDAHCVADKVTVFEFSAPACHPCKEMETHLQARLANDDKLAVRKIIVTDWESPLVDKYLSQVDAMPYIVVYGPDGKQSAAAAAVTPSGVDLMIEGALTKRAAEPKQKRRNYEIRAEAADAKIGADAVAEVKITPAEGFKINREFPWAATVGANDGLNVTAASFDREAWTLADQEAALDIPFRATSKGDHKLPASITFSVCSDTQCEVIRDHNLDIVVSASSTD